MVFFAVRTRLRRNDLTALFAVKSVLKEQRRNADLFRLKVIEYLLGVVGTVILAHARMVAPDDHVRAAIVLAAQRMENRLARTRIVHRRREDAEYHAVGRVIVA